MARRTGTNRAGVRALLEQKVLEVTQKLTLDAGRNLVMASPVDDGDFRAAWDVQPPTAPFQAGTIENHIEYAVPLANGHSPQAPAGWIENELTAAVKGS